MENFVTVPAFSIYDTGGTDTFDASRRGTKQVINLIAESFSSIGGPTNNMTVARNVMI